MQVKNLTPEFVNLFNTRLGDFKTLFKQAKPIDKFAWLQSRTYQHLKEHHCGAYPEEDGTIQLRISQAFKPLRLLELGTALGYSSCQWAEGSQDVIIDTIEMDPDHCKLARQNLDEAGFKNNVVIHQGKFNEVMKNLQSEYDIVFFDGFSPKLQDLSNMHKLLKQGGALVSSNIRLDTGEYLEAIKDKKEWDTHQITNDLCISMKKKD